MEESDTLIDEESVDDARLLLAVEAAEPILVEPAIEEPVTPSWPPEGVSFRKLVSWTSSNPWLSVGADSSGQDSGISFTGRRRRLRAETSTLLEKRAAREMLAKTINASVQPAVPPQVMDKPESTDGIPAALRPKAGRTPSNWDEVFEAPSGAGPLNAKLAEAGKDLSQAYPNLLQRTPPARRAPARVGLPRGRLVVLGLLLLSAGLMARPEIAPPQQTILQVESIGETIADIQLGSDPPMGAQWAVMLPSGVVVQTNGWGAMPESERTYALQALWVACNEPMHMSVLGDASVLVAEVRGGRFVMLPPPNEAVVSKEAP